MQRRTALLIAFICQCSVLYDATMAASGYCVYSYELLRSSLRNTPGNTRRLLSAFFPSAESSPDVVDVTYTFCNRMTSENLNLECSDDDDMYSDNVVSTQEVNYTWTDKQLFLSIDPEYFQISTVWLFQVRKSSLKLIINPFCDGFNISNSSQVEMLLMLTSWLRSYALTYDEESGHRGYAVVRDESEKGVTNETQFVGGLVAGTAFTMVSSVAFLLTIAWFLINWDDNFLPSLTILSTVFTLAAFAVFAAVLDLVLIVLYANVPYFALSALPMYGSVIFVLVELIAFLGGFLLDKGKCSIKLGIVTLITGALSLTVPSFCSRFFWIGLAALVYPVRVGSVLLVLTTLAFVLTFAVVVLVLLCFTYKEVEGAMEYEFKFSHAVMTAILTCIIAFLVALFCVYVSIVSVINSDAADPLTSLVTIVFPIFVGFITVRFSLGLIVVKKKKKKQAPAAAPPAQKSKSRPEKVVP